VAHQDLLKEAAWILAFLTTREDDYIRVLLEMGLVERLVQVLVGFCKVITLPPS